MIFARRRVSNFSVKNLEILLAETSIVPAVNQVEANIYHPQSSLHTYCSDKGIHLTAYCPLGQPKGDAGSAVLKEPLLKELADKYGKPLGSVSFGGLSREMAGEALGLMVGCDSLRLL